MKFEKLNFFKIKKHLVIFNYSNSKNYKINSALNNENELRIIDRHLKAKGIQMRSIRMVIF
jgi:hypothetical protein